MDGSFIDPSLVLIIYYIFLFLSNYLIFLCELRKKKNCLFKFADKSKIAEAENTTSV